jgi:hypothetical protein
VYVEILSTKVRILRMLLSVLFEGVPKRMEGSGVA